MIPSPSSNQLKLSFLSTVASSRFSHTNFSEAPPEEPPEEPSVSFSSRARRDGFVSTANPKEVETAVQAVGHSVVPFSTGGKVIPVALGVLGGGVIFAGAIVPSILKKAPPADVLPATAKVVETTVEKAIDTVAKFASEIVADATSPSSHSQPQSSSLETRIGNLFTHAGKLIGEINPFNQQNHPVATAATVKSAQKEVAPPPPKCQKGEQGYPTYAYYRDSQDPNVRLLVSTIEAGAIVNTNNSNTALASRDLYQFCGFLSDLVCGEVTVKVQTSAKQNQYKVKTLKPYWADFRLVVDPVDYQFNQNNVKTPKGLLTVPVMQQILLKTERLLQVPTSITGAELERDHLQAKIDLYRATLDAYLSHGVKPSNLKELSIQPNESKNQGLSSQDICNSILAAGEVGNDITQHLTGLLQILLQQLETVATKEQTLYFDNAQLFRAEKNTTILPWSRSYHSQPSSVSVTSSHTPMIPNNVNSVEETGSPTSSIGQPAVQPATGTVENAQKEVAPPSPKCKKGEQGYPAYAAHIDSQKPNVRLLALTIQARGIMNPDNSNTALASRDLYEFCGFLSDLVCGEVTVKVQTSPKNQKQYRTSTLKLDGLHTVPIMQQILSDTENLLQVPTLITGAELERDHLQAKIKLYRATLKAYLSHGVNKPSNWAELTQLTEWEKEHESADLSSQDICNSILVAGEVGNDITQHLTGLLQILLQQLETVAKKEQTLYWEAYNLFRVQKKPIITLPFAPSH